MRVLGVDYGDKRTGLALSDPAGFMASGLYTISADGKKQLAQKALSTLAASAPGDPR